MAKGYPLMLGQYYIRRKHFYHLLSMLCLAGAIGLLVSANAGKASEWFYSAAMLSFIYGPCYLVWIMSHDKFYFESTVVIRHESWKKLFQQRIGLLFFESFLCDMIYTFFFVAAHLLVGEKLSLTILFLQCFIMCPPLSRHEIPKR